MIGITEYTVAGIYDYIHRHEDRAFVLKFFAMEIYNEVVRDLLSADSLPLRVVDDPEASHKNGSPSWCFNYETAGLSLDDNSMVL
ncbi:unnamed protein product [Camellia sinensis]